MKKSIFFLFAIISVAMLFGCRGSQQNRLVGYWKQVPFTNPETTSQTYYWQFYAGSGAVRERYIDNVLEDSVSYTYSIDGSVLSIFAATTEQEEAYLPSSGEPLGEFWVDVLTNEKLKATRRKHSDGSEDAAFLRIEMVKVN